MTPILLSLGVFAVYWATLSRGVLGGDAGELQFVPGILALAHPTGYPLQVLLHWAWGFLPIGTTVAYRLNVLDALIAAGAVGLVAACGRWMGGGRGPALLGAATFAFGELWWSQAVTGDKYTLNGLLLALVLLLFLRWRARRDAGSLRMLALAYGLGLTHHRVMLLVGPALALGLFLEGWRPRGRREPLILLALGILPLVLYLYLPWAGGRGLPPGSWRVDTPLALGEYLLDRGYTSQVRLGPELGGRLAEEATVLLRSFGPLGILFGLLGLALQARRDPRLAAVLGTAFLPQAVLAAGYSLESHYALPRHWVFFLPAFLIWSLWVTVGLDGARGALGRALSGAAPARQALAAGAVVALFLLSQAATAWARGAESVLRAQAGAETLDGYRQDLQRSPLAERFGRLALEAADPDAVLVGDWEQATVLWYLQRVEGFRPDLTIRYPIESLDDALAAARQDGRPLYATRTVPGLATYGVSPSSAGPLLRLLPPPSDALPTGALAVGGEGELEGGVSLVGVSYHAEAVVGGALPFTLYWRAERPLGEDHAVSVHLAVADSATAIARHEARHPALETSPTSSWRPGEVIGDYHELPLGNRLAPGQYRVVVAMHRPEPSGPLRRLAPHGDAPAEAIVLPPFELRPRPPGPLDLFFRLRGR